MTPLSPPGPMTGTDHELKHPAACARSAKPRHARLTLTAVATTGCPEAAARPTGPPAGPNGRLDHGASSPPGNPSDAAQTRDWPPTRWMHSRSVPSAAPSADRISDRLDDGSA